MSNKMTAEQKAQQRFVERARRWMNQHPEYIANWKKANPEGTDEQAQESFERAAMQALQREDYERLPIPKRLTIIERTVAGIHSRTLALEQNAQALEQNTFQNYSTLAISTEVAFKALGKALEKLGVSEEEQEKFFAEAKAEAEAAIEQQRREAEEAEKTARDAAEERNIAESLQKEDGNVLAEEAEEAEPPPIPEGATVFGGD